MLQIKKWVLQYSNLLSSQRNQSIFYLCQLRLSLNIYCSNGTVLVFLRKNLLI